MSTREITEDRSYHKQSSRGDDGMARTSVSSWGKDIDGGSRISRNDEGSGDSCYYSSNSATTTVEDFDNELDVPSSLFLVSSIIRAAKDLDCVRPRVAWLCRKRALEMANKLDESSTGRGVPQFKTALTNRISQDAEQSKRARLGVSDKEEIGIFYKHCYRDYKKLKADKFSNRFELQKQHEFVSALYEVFRPFQHLKQPDCNYDDFREIEREVEAQQAFYARYNILPLDSAGESEVIMQLEEIKTAVSALKYTRGLPPIEIAGGEWDLLDWLSAVFGFQNDSVRNQREHLILQLAPPQARLKLDTSSELDDRAIDAVIENFLKNYKTWCTSLQIEHHLSVPQGQDKGQQRKLLYIGLYLLIWGESANVRFLPECLCYIFHNMAYELQMLLSKNACVRKPQDAFLCEVITPIYQVIQKESSRNKDGTAPHSAWCNYDDLNEYFWSPSCFDLGWPLRKDGDFFKSCHESGSLGKSYFVEARSVLQTFRSFSRLWTLNILSFQILVIIAWNDISKAADIFLTRNLYNLSSVFVTSAFLYFIQCLLHIGLNFSGYHRWKFTDVLRNILKLVASFGWSIYFLMHNIYNKNFSPLYLVAMAIYVVPDIVDSFLMISPKCQLWFENSNTWIIKVFFWWLSQPGIFVGNGIQQTSPSFIKYTLFWTVLFCAKFAFSFLYEIQPYIQPTKSIMKITRLHYAWHEFFPHDVKNYGGLAALWLPVILVYFMDTQIWYAIFSTLSGGMIGLFDRLGEIRTMRKLESRFQSIPGAFNAYLLPSDRPKKAWFSFSKQHAEVTRIEVAKFAQVWNEIVSSLREEDLVSDRELDLLLVPYCSGQKLNLIQWPLYLLVSKVHTAINLAQSRFKDIDLCKRISEDDFMKCAVIECFESFKLLLQDLVVGNTEKRIIEILIKEVESNISNNTLLENFRMEKLPALFEEFVKLVECLKDGNASKYATVVFIMQTIYEIVTKDMIHSQIPELVALEHGSKEAGTQLFARAPDSGPVIVFPTTVTPEWEEQIKRLYLLVSIEEASLDVPKNLEARRRITFFTNSLFMKMPRAPTVRGMISFSLLTPYYSEETVYSKSDLDLENEDGISVRYYLRKIFPDEWENFMERLNYKDSSEILESDVLQLRHWVSLRGQTLFRTVRGMMYYRRALKLQAFLDVATEDQLLDGCKGFTFPEEVEALADLKFTYVVTCQTYGTQKRRSDRRARDILSLMVNNPALRVAYIDEVEEKEGRELQKVYYSVLIKAVNNVEQEIYRIKLPGSAIIGEGKPENQNHAIIFTRGEALQTIDMNQDNYLEEAFKMRNLLEEFHEDHGERPPTILGVREHIFTGSVSSLAWFMSNQEASFVTIGQRVLARLLKVRFHYGHPDVFDRVFHITRGGISKASKGINLSEDIFAGFNSTLRRGNITHHEYIQVGKGRDVGLSQISLFEAKVACGNGEQTISRDIYRLGKQFDFFRMLSCYYTTTGFYVSSMLVVLTVYAYMYGRLYLSLSGLEVEIVKSATMTGDTALESVMAYPCLIQMGLLMGLPMIMEVGLERGFKAALGDLIIMQMLMGPVFFTFSLGTKIHFFGRTILHGGAKYRATGRGFVVRHEKFAESYRMFSRSHFTKAMELFVLLVVYQTYGSAATGSRAYFFLTASIWFLVVSWLFSPFLFNPSGFEWHKIVEDWEDWSKWVSNRGGIGVLANKSWESWWEEEQDHLLYTGLFGRLMESFISFRFFLYQYGIVYHLRLSHDHKSIMVYGLSWLAILVIIGMLKILSVGRKKLSADFHLMFRLLKLVLFVVYVAILVILFKLVGLTVGDIFASFLACIPTGWGILQISQAWRRVMKRFGMWGSVKGLGRVYERMMGVMIFTPVAILAWFPMVYDFQTRILFNQAFSRGLHIQRILSGGKKKRG